ncbi:hypothetical protein [Xanthobacter sp. ZOL 2024]
MTCAPTPIAVLWRQRQALLTRATAARETLNAVLALHPSFNCAVSRSPETLSLDEVAEGLCPPQFRTTLRLQGGGALVTTNPTLLRHMLREHPCTPKQAGWARARLAAIEAAEAAEARQREASGLAAAEAEQDAADDALELLEERLLTTPARSLADLAAKAHTLHRQRDAFDEMEPRHVDALLADILALAAPSI